MSLDRRAGGSPGHRMVEPRVLEITPETCRSVSLDIGSSSVSRSQDHRSEDLFDPARLANIEHAVGRSSMIGLLSLFEKELLVRPARIAALLRGGSIEKAAMELHDLKGAMLNMGAVAIGNHARRLEQACKAGNSLDLIDRLIELTDATLIALRDLQTADGR